MNIACIDKSIDFSTHQEFVGPIYQIIYNAGR